MTNPPINQVVFFYWDSNIIPEDVISVFDTWSATGAKIEIYNIDSASEYIQKFFGKNERSLFLECAVPAMRSDYFRVCRSLVGGGLYVDSGISCIQWPFQFFSPSSPLVCMRGWHGRIVNGIFFSNGQSKMLKNIHEKIRTNVNDRSSNNIWETTGAGAWINTINSKGTENGDNEIRIIEHTEIQNKYIKLGQIGSSGRGRLSHWSEIQKTQSIFQSARNDR